jgi:hypothetical protein
MAYLHRSPILVTSDEPVVSITGPYRPRTEGGSVGIAGVVIFPLTPGLLLAAFDGYKASPAKPDQLGHCDIADINREIVAVSSTYAFERPGRKTAAAFKLPVTPPPTAISEPIPVANGRDGQFIIRSHRPSRWSAETHVPPGQSSDGSTEAGSGTHRSPILPSRFPCATEAGSSRKPSFLATDILSMGRAFGEIHARVRDTTGTPAHLPGLGPSAGRSSKTP